MVPKKRLSIAFLMAVVFFVATDFAIVKAIWELNDPYDVIAVTTLPMINLLLLVLPKLKRRDARPFWLGFEVVGLLMVFLFVLFGWFQEDLFYSPIEWVNHHDPFQTGTAVETAFLISFAVLFYTTPQVLAALLGGRLLARYRVLIERWPRSAGVQDGVDACVE